MRDSSAIRERIRNRRPDRIQDPMRGRELTGYLALCALIALPAVFLLWQQTDCVRTRFAVESLRHQKLALQESYRRLRTENATLEALPRIAERAARQGLVPSEDPRVRTLVDGPLRGPAPPAASAGLGVATAGASRQRLAGLRDTDPGILQRHPPEGRR